MDRLTELQTLVAIVAEGSLAGAGRRLGRSAPMVTRTLAELERRAGISLVERSTRRCQPTPAGRRLADHARNLLAGYEDAMRESAGNAAVPRGLIRITAPTIFGRDHVTPALVGFLESYPEIEIDLQLSDRVIDLVEENFDLAVRIGVLADSDLVARNVGAVRQFVVASPDYLALHGTPKRPEDLASHAVVQHARHGLDTPWVFRENDGRSVSVGVSARFGVNQPDAAVHAALRGCGLVTVLSHQVQAELRDKQLIRVLKPFEPRPLPVSLVWPSSRHLWRRMRLVVDCLADDLKSCSFSAEDRTGSSV